MLPHALGCMIICCRQRITIVHMQVAPGGALILAGLIIDMQQPSNTSLPPNMTQPIDVAWYDQVGPRSSQHMLICQSSIIPRGQSAASSSKQRKLLIRHMSDLCKAWDKTYWAS